MKTRLMQWLLAALMLGVAPLAHAFPWLGLVKQNTASQTNETITLSQVFDPYYLDLRLNTDGNPVGALSYYITTSPANVVRYGVTPLTPLDNPFVAADLTDTSAHTPVAGAIVNSGADGVTTWYKPSTPDYPAFTAQSIATYQFDISTLGAGTYVFRPVGTLLAYGAGEEINNFETPGLYVLTIIAVPEPGTGALLVCGAWAAAWRNRRRNTR